MKLRCLYSASCYPWDRNKIDLSGLPRIRLADVHAGYSSSEVDTNKCSWVRPFCSIWFMFCCFVLSRFVVERDINTND